MKTMKFLTLTTAIACAFAGPVRAASTTVKISNVHLCCNSCVKGIDRAIAKVQGASAASDKDAGTVAITAPDTATAQKAVNAIVAAGYFGTTSDAGIQIQDKSGAKDEKVKSLAVNNVHLCCAKCVKAVNAAISGVKGVSGNTAEKDAETFSVTGDFNAKDVFAALNKAGLAGKAGK